MITQCPCPRPPGGSVTCEGHQFAYCHVVKGEVQSGCIPIPSWPQAAPSEARILSLFNKVLTGVGFEEWTHEGVLIVPDRSFADQTIQFLTSSATHVLHQSMRKGAVVSLCKSTDSLRKTPLLDVWLLVRFPQIWSNSGGEPYSPAHGAW